MAGLYQLCSCKHSPGYINRNIRSWTYLNMIEFPPAC